MIPPRKFLSCFIKAAYNTVYHDGIELAGYLAFLSVLALFPFLVFVLALAGFVGEGKAGTEFIQLLTAVLPPDMMKALVPRIAEIISGPPAGPAHCVDSGCYLDVVLGGRGLSHRA